jgi:glucose/mannose transport system substrate-binding protein
MTRRLWRKRAARGIRIACVSFSIPVVAAWTGCGDQGTANGGAGDAGTGAPSTEIYSWWLLGGEAQALQQVFQAYTAAYPKVRLINAAAQNNTVGYDARADLAARMAAKNPPDAFQETGDLPAWVTTGNGIQQLDDFFAAQGWASQLYPFLTAPTLVDGKRYAIPTDIGSQNVIWYNKRVFSTNNLAPPKTWAEFVLVAEALKTKGIAAMGMTLQGWVMRIVFDALIAEAAPDATKRGQFLLDVYAGKASDGTSTAALALKTAIANFDALVNNYVNTDWATPDVTGNTPGWDALAERVKDGSVAMFLHGDWVKGLLDNIGETGGVDYDAVFFPDGAATNTYLYNVDTFCLPVGARNEQGGKDFIQTFLAPTTQVAFASKKGSCPVRADADLTRLDAVAQEICAHIGSKTYQVSVNEDFDSILQNAYSQGTDGGLPSSAAVQDTIYRQIATTYPPQ